MSEVNWGLPIQRTAKVEKFDTPVLIMSALSEKGSGRKFSFNKAAQELLGLIGGESHVKIGFGDGNIYVQGLTAEGDNTFSMTKKCTFSNKRVYEYIVKTSNLTTTEENYLHLVKVDDQPFVIVSHMSSDSAPEKMNGDSTSEVTLVEPTATEETVEETTEETWS